MRVVKLTDLSIVSEFVSSETITNVYVEAER